MSMNLSILAETRESSLGFLQRMVNRMDLSRIKYGPVQANYSGEYTKEFLLDLKKTLSGFLRKWESKSSTTAGGNALLFCLKRVLAYVNGFRGKPGNTEYLIDAANGLMIEYTHPQIAGATMTETDSDKSPGFVGLSHAEAETYRQ